MLGARRIARSQHRDRASTNDQDPGLLVLGNLVALISHHSDQSVGSPPILLPLLNEKEDTLHLSHLAGEEDVKKKRKKKIARLDLGQCQG